MFFDNLRMERGRPFIGAVSAKAFAVSAQAFAVSAKAFAVSKTLRYRYGRSLHSFLWGCNWFRLITGIESSMPRLVGWPRKKPTKR